ncbi:hypothetical protein [Flavobacterium sp.]|uniref:hypothetical protein n=1 Tax=Flavobacterium sp. TaxID=239 RepID=UPI0025E2C854|nr:hypothetical protein [Flavobacterium sp.]
MIKRLTLIISLLLVTSCASRKVAIVKEDTKTTIDSTAIVKTDSISTIKNNIITIDSSSEIEVCPISDTIPMIINGISYKNAILKYKKHSKISSDTSEKKVSKTASKQVHKSKEEVKSLKNKSIDKKANYFVYLWLLLIPIGMYIYRQIKNKLLL